jgi:hypothetical protein
MRSSVPIFPGSDLQECKRRQAHDRDADLSRKQNAICRGQRLLEPEDIHNDVAFWRPCNSAVSRFDATKRHEIHGDLAAMSEPMLLSFNGPERTGAEQPLSQRLKFVLATNGEGEIDVLRPALHGNSSTMMEMQITGERAHHDACKAHGAQGTHHICRNFSVQCQFRPL